MAPIRRYLRISKYSVLECRIFLENPADGPRWLLNPEDPALPRVFEAIRHLVLPKLREENERAKGKGKKKKSVKDIVTGDDFAVSVFLTEIATRHSLLKRSKTFKNNDRITSNANKMTGTDKAPLTIRDESDDDSDVMRLDRIPPASDGADDDERPKKRARNGTRSKVAEEDVDDDDKKKLAFKTSYEGFSIWGWVLCLLVDRKGGPGKKASGSDAQALMAEWITSTQLQREDDG